MSDELPTAEDLEREIGNPTVGMQINSDGQFTRWIRLQEVINMKELYDKIKAEPEAYGVEDPERFGLR